MTGRTRLLAPAMEDGRGGAVEDGVFGYYAPSSPSPPPSTTLGGGGGEWWIDCDDETDADTPRAAAVRCRNSDVVTDKVFSVNRQVLVITSFLRETKVFFFLLILTYGCGYRAAKRTSSPRGQTRFE